MPYLSKALPFSFLRIFAVLTVVGLKSLLPPLTYISLFWAVLFGHYALSVFYARSSAASIAKEPKSWLPIFGLLALSLISFQSGFDPILVLYFGFHHAISETYMANTYKDSGLSIEEHQGLVLSRFSLTLITYLILQSQYFSISETSRTGIIACAFVFFFLVAFKHWKNREAVERSRFFDLSLFEVIGILSLTALLKAEVSFEDMIFYHLLVWMFYPLVGSQRQRSQKQRRRYIYGTFAITFFFFIFTPATRLFPVFDFELWREQAFFWGYFHISTSFFLSQMNPQWVKRLFISAPEGGHSLPLT